MKSVCIKLGLADEIKKFVAIAEKYDFDIDIRSGRHSVNAKSLLGIFSLDLSQQLVVEILTNDCENFLQDIAEFIV